MQYKFFRGFGLLALLTFLVASLSSVGAQEAKVLRMDLGATDVPTLDPALATDSSSIQVLELTYTGLTVLDEVSLEIQPGLAQSWEMAENADGSVTYTFNLKPEVSWVKYNAESGAVEQVMVDGAPRYVTAADVAYGMTRTLSPITAGDYAYVLAPQVVGGVEFNGQTVAEDGSLTLAADTLGIVAVDEYTLQVSSPRFFAFQLNIFGMWLARPQPEWVIAEHGEFWIEAENFVSYGPYALKEWLHDESMTLTKNPFWAGIDASPVAQIDEIQFLFLDQSTALAMYEAGELDVLDDVSTADIPRIKADPVLSEQYREGVLLCTYYFNFSVTVAPFDNVHIRRAFSYAIDRQDIVDNVTRSGQLPARFFSNPGLAAAPLQENYPDLGIGFDPDKALEELALGLEEMGLADVAGLPPITLAFNTSEGHQRIAEAVADQWEEILGVQVQLTNQEFAVFLESRRAQTFPVNRNGWCQDYPDAHNFLYDVYHSSSSNNDTGWTSEAFDALIEEAAILTDTAARTELYAQAENILVMEDAVIAPVYFYADVSMTQPYVERTFGRGSGQSIEKWDLAER